MPLQGIDRVFSRLPRTELERRWAAVRDHLADEGLDALVAWDCEDFLGGPVRWLTDRATTNAYAAAVIFHADDLMTLVEHGAIGGHRALGGRDADYPGVDQVHTTAAFRSARYTTGYEAQIVADVLNRRGYRRVAIAGMAAIPYAFVSGLQTGVAAEIVDVSDFMERTMAVKSACEQGYIRATARLQDTIFERLLDRIAPGMSDAEIAGWAQLESRRLGSEQGVVMSGSAKIGTLAAPQTPHWQARRLERGDLMTILIECNGPEGFYTEMVRTVVFGAASSELKEAFAMSCEAQAAIVGGLRAGVDPRAIAAAHDDWLAAHGQPPERRLVAHGQGYPLVERPLIRADETMMLQADMILVAHPAIVTPNALGLVCDNYVIGGAEGAERIHQTPQQIFEL